MSPSDPKLGGIIDTDIHQAVSPERMRDFLPEPWRTRFAVNRGSGHIGGWNPNGVRRADARTEDGWIDESPTALGRWFLDEHRITYGILNQSLIGTLVTPEPDFAAAVAAASNDVVAADWLPADERLRASILVSSVDPPLAAREIERWAGHPGFVQVMTPAATQMPLGHRFYHPIYEAAARHGLPVAIHPGAEGSGVSAGGPAVPNGYFAWHTGLITGYITHLISLVTEGVFQKFPSLKFVLVEGGVAWLPPLMWRFDKNWKALRMTTPWLTRPPSAVIAEHVYLTTQPIEEPEDVDHFRAMLGMFPADRMLMFSSDYPHWDGDTPDFAARAFPPETRRRVLFENARELYRLPAVPAAAPGMAAAHAG